LGHITKWYAPFQKQFLSLFKFGTRFVYFHKGVCRIRSSRAEISIHHMNQPFFRDIVAKGTYIPSRHHWKGVLRSCRWMRSPGPTSACLDFDVPINCISVQSKPIVET
jgi:hypothetical protein